jgi:Glycosyl hydrolases family 16/Bacterial TSP3 repeat
MSRSDGARTEENTPMLRWLVLPMAVLAYTAVGVGAATPRDRDHDRLPDRWERNHHLSTTRPSAQRDPDRDRLNNLRELRLRTHPRRADTDRDGLRDGAEVRRFHTNPRKRDTDGDRFSDRCELRQGTNPRRRRSRPKRGCSRLPIPEPSPIAGMGYHETFRDDFDTLNRSVWDDHVWYDESPHSDWTGFQQVDSTGVLHLRTSRNFSCGSGCNYPMNTVTTQSSGRTFQYGYFEARMKWTKGNGAWPAFWLYSYQHAIDEDQCTTQAGEIDVVEGQGSEPNVRYGTVHSNTNGCAPPDDQNGNNYQPGDADLTAGFHTYAALWTPTTISWYMDDEPIMSAPTYTTINQRMFLLLQMWSGGWTEDPDATTPDVIETQVDWVRVWQKSG